MPLVTNISTEFLTYDTEPENIKLLIPIPFDPFVVIYVASITFPSCSFFPNIPSPKINSYLSPSTS